MIGFRVFYDREVERIVRRKMDKGAFRSMSNAAAAIRQTARRFIRRGKKAARPGEPIRTRRGKAKRADAILYHTDRVRKTSLIGFTYSAMRESMSPHEHGGAYLGAVFPQRPVMGPALKANLIRFGDEFRGSLGR